MFFLWKGTNFEHLEDPGISCIRLNLSFQTPSPQKIALFGGSWGTQRIPRKDWGTLGKIRGSTTPPLRILSCKVLFVSPAIFYRYFWWFLVIEFQDVIAASVDKLSANLADFTQSLNAFAKVPSKKSELQEIFGLYEQWKKTWLFGVYRGLYYPVI